MSIYSTNDITREEAERLVLACRNATARPLQGLSNEELDQELHQYVYRRTESGESPYDDILPWGINYMITD